MLDVDIKNIPIMGDISWPCEAEIAYIIILQNVSTRNMRVLPVQRCKMISKLQTNLGESFITDQSAVYQSL